MMPTPLPLAPAASAATVRQPTSQTATSTDAVVSVGQQPKSSASRQNGVGVGQHPSGSASEASSSSSAPRMSPVCGTPTIMMSDTNASTTDGIFKSLESGAQCVLCILWCGCGWVLTYLWVLGVCTMNGCIVFVTDPCRLAFETRLS